jgi:uncharacterized membrane protein
MNPEKQIQDNPYNLPPVKQVSPHHIFRWLALGWKDMQKAGAPSLLHGVILTGISVAIITITLFYWALLPGAVTGFLLTGPFLATGLYVLSQRLEAGRPASFEDVVHAWRHGSRYLLNIGLLLVLSATAWVLFSVLMFHFFIDITILEPLDFLRHILTQDDQTFMLWTILGGLGTALAFAASVISIPLLVDREVSTQQAILTSVASVGHNPGTMLLWAMTIFIFTGLSLITFMLGFIIFYPILGHASWHAYRDMIDASGLPLRPSID